MDLEIIILNEVESDRERQVTDDDTYMWDLKYDTNGLTKQKQTHRHRKQTYGCQRGRRAKG